MGSFYSTCSITNMTLIENQEAVLQFIYPTYIQKDVNILKYFKILSSKEPIASEQLIASIERALSNKYDRTIYEKGLSLDSHFAPFGPAIYGKYYDYGELTFSEDPQNLHRIKLLEEAFGISIGELIESMLDNKIHSNEVLNHLTFTHINANVYRKLIEGDSTEPTDILIDKINKVNSLEDIEYIYFRYFDYFYNLDQETVYKLFMGSRKTQDFTWLQENNHFYIFI